jgi:serine/threonine-protein kinase
VVAARLLPNDPTGRHRVDHYELVGEIASGGMATVYLARRAGVGGFQRFVAIKRLHAHLAEEAEFVEMFLDEARLAALIHHPNVISITEVGANERGYYLVMDYVEGDTLARLLAIAAEQNTVLPIGIGLRIVIDMLTGLHASHELRDDQGEIMGLVHRDVSPQNVLVGVDGISRLSDFGVARAAARLAGTRAGQLKGKIAYMAPEQAAADDSIDRRADVFSAGVVLWEVLTGRRLFKSTNDAATLSRVVSERVEPPVSIIEGLDTRVSDICMKALERPLGRRYQTAALFADQLEQAAGRRGLLATSKDVALYVQKVLGEEISQQREAVRRWVAVSDCTDEHTPSGSVRAPSVQNRGERFVSSPSSPASSQRIRKFENSQGIDSGPNDVTLAAPSPVFGSVGYFRLYAIAIGALLVMGIAFVVFFRPKRPVVLPPKHQFVIAGHAPVKTTLLETTHSEVGNADASAFERSIVNESGKSSVTDVGKPISTTVVSGQTLLKVGQPSSSVIVLPPTAATANNGTKPRPVVPPPKTSAVTDVDLTNPYR